MNISYNVTYNILAEGEYDWGRRNGTISADPLAKSGYSSVDKSDDKGGSVSNTYSFSQDDDCSDEESFTSANSFLTEPTYEGILERFLQFYGTVENYLRSYGGPVSVKTQESGDLTLGNSGEIKISFNRRVLFPKELI